MKVSIQTKCIGRTRGLPEIICFGSFVEYVIHVSLLILLVWYMLLYTWLYRVHQSWFICWILFNELWVGGVCPLSNHPIGQEPHREEKFNSPSLPIQHYHFPTNLSIPTAIIPTPVWKMAWLFNFDRPFHFMQRTLEKNVVTGPQERSLSTNGWSLSYEFCL